MVTSSERRGSGDANKLQDVELRQLQRSYDGTVQSARGDRVLKVGPVLVHNAHIQAGRATGSGCPICLQGLEGALATSIQDRLDAAKPEVVEGDGADGSGDPSPPYGYGYDT